VHATLDVTERAAELPFVIRVREHKALNHSNPAEEFNKRRVCFEAQSETRVTYYARAT
jgi:hypothetical protein